MSDCSKCGRAQPIGGFLRYCSGNWFRRLFGCPRGEHIHDECLNCGAVTIKPVRPPKAAP